nr:uncharacterized protein LOC103419956 isoform X1 [Malus domestica]
MRELGFEIWVLTYAYCSLSARRSRLIPWSDLPRIAIGRWRWRRRRTNRRMWISSMRISDGPIWTAMAGLVAMKPSLSSRALVTQTGPLRSFLFFTLKGFQQQQLMPGPGARHMAPPAGGRPPKTVAPSHAEEKQQAN